MRTRASSIASGTTAVLLALGAVTSACGSSNPANPLGGSSGGSSNGGVAAGAGGVAAAGASGVGPAAGGSIGMFASGGSAGAAACLPAGGACKLSSDCCGDAVCNTNTPAAELLGCRPACNTTADCASGCCMPYGGQAQGFCADAKWCQCGADGSQCGTMQPACCDTQFCVGNQAGTGYECRKKCAVATDCTTSCCMAIPGTSVSACLDAVYCGK